MSKLPATVDWVVSIRACDKDVAVFNGVADIIVVMPATTADVATADSAIRAANTAFNIWNVCRIKCSVDFVSINMQICFTHYAPPPHLQTDLLLSLRIKYPNSVFLYQPFPLLYLLTFLHHRQNLLIFLRLGVQAATESEISKIFSSCPNKQSDSDPTLTWLLKECSSVLIPTITNIVNLSLSSGQFRSVPSSSQAINHISPSQETHSG